MGRLRVYAQQTGLSFRQGSSAKAGSNKPAFIGWADDLGQAAKLLAEHNRISGASGKQSLIVEDAEGRQTRIPGQ